jgi:hypothetical protein
MKNVFNLEVNKSVDSKKQLLGAIELPYPTLDELGVQDAEVAKVNEDGTPEYVTDVHNFVFTAVLERVKSMARNKLKSGTLELKFGQSIATDLETLCKPSVGANGEALKAVAELKKEFKEWLAELGLADKAQAFIYGQFVSPNGLLTQPEAVREKIAIRVEAFAEAWLAGSTANAAGEQHINKVLDACNPQDELDMSDL